jgi:hypothetical protein
VTRKDSGILTIDTDRSIEAVVSSVTISDPHYNQTIVPMEINFIAAQPFFSGNQQIVTLNVTADTTLQTISTTISGSVFAEPLIIYNAPAGSGKTALDKIVLTYGTTGETLTWSGGGDFLSLGSFVRFDFSKELILEGTTEVEPTGVFSRIEPGATTLTVLYNGTTTSTSSSSSTTRSTSSSTTYSGTTTSTSQTSTSTSITTTSMSTTTTLAGAPGGNLQIIYRPRYL